MASRQRSNTMPSKKPVEKHVNFDPRPRVHSFSTQEPAMSCLCSPEFKKTWQAIQTENRCSSLDDRLDEDEHETETHNDETAKNEKKKLKPINEISSRRGSLPANKCKDRVKFTYNRSNCPRCALRNY